MKKNLNVIQIKGIRGLIFAGFVITCLGAGFIIFPGWVGMHIWNALAAYAQEVPSIGIIQGVLLWGIIMTTYFIFRKDKVVVCFKTPEGLSEEELKTVFADIKKQSESDPVLQAMIRAREAELKIQNKENESDK